MKNIFFNKIKNNSKGATLIELLMAVIIFSTVMTAVIGILISAIKANKAIIAKQENIDNARYAMEFMTKELRMAKENAILDLTFNDGAATPAKLAGGVYSSMNFTISVCNPACAEHSIKYSRRYYPADANGGEYYAITRSDMTDSTGEQPISSNNIDVTALNFFINDWDLAQGSGKAPLITIFMEMKGRKGIAKDQIVNLQSSVSPRIY